MPAIPVSFPSDPLVHGRQEETKFELRKEIECDVGHIRGIYEEFLFRNLSRKKSASEADLLKNDGFPTLPLDAMIEKSRAEYEKKHKRDKEDEGE